MNSNFIRDIVIEDIKNKKHEIAITRFPPEPNGLLHIGHAKAITINFDIAEEFGGYTYLRFDDTNPAKEDDEFVNQIQEDIKWLGFEWKEMRYASDYFDFMYDKALVLINKGLAYVDDLSPDEIREYRGTLTEPGKNSPYRERSIKENLEFFKNMTEGMYEEGEKVLRAKIDMSSPNINMRDPIIYRIVKTPHYRLKNKWNIYPMYDFAHPLEDSIEAITHSLCSIEFEDNRPLYNWYVKNTEVVNIPRQIEFARLNITNSILGKRNIIKMVKDNLIDGWDDPRLLTISGMRRRGYTPDGIKNFIRATGVAKADSLVDIKMLEHFIREDLKESCDRVMCVIDPVKVVITNKSDEIEYLEAENNPLREDRGNRKVAFSNEIYIEREDIVEEVPNKKYKRLAPGLEVRLKFAYFIKCNEIIKDDTGKIVEVHCTYDPETKSGTGFKGRKPNGTIHWVDAKENAKVVVNRYTLLFTDNYDKTKTIEEQIDPNSLTVFRGYAEAYLKDSKPYDKYQFLRHGYFSVDPKHIDELTFNETVTMKSSYKVKID